MRNKRRRKGAPSQDGAQREPKPPAVGTAFGPLLARAGLNRLADSKRAPSAETARKRGAEPARPPEPGAAKPKGPKAAVSEPPAPAPELSQRELSLLHRAYQGVQPIDRPKRGRVDRDVRRGERAGRAADAGEESAAAARLSDLVGGGVRFDVRWEDGFVAGLRAGQTPKLLSRLRGSGFTPEAQLDLHGLRRAEVQRAVSEFVRAQHRRGRRYLLIITGRGQHSEGGVGVLGEALAEALGRGGAAASVLAFASAHANHGGQGAVAVMLK